MAQICKMNPKIKVCIFMVKLLGCWSVFTFFFLGVCGLSIFCHEFVYSKLGCYIFLFKSRFSETQFFC